MAGGGFDAGGFAGGLVGAAGSLLGGLMGQQSADQIAQENIDYQKEFAQNGIQWRVEDAKHAGINPLAALGASTTSFSNVVGSDDLGKGVSQAGQDLGRALKSTMSPDDQATVDAQNALKLQNLQLQNDLLGVQVQASKMRLLNQPGNGAPTPSPAGFYDALGIAVPGTSAQSFPSGFMPGMENVSSRMVPGEQITGGGESLPSREASGAGFFPLSRWQFDFNNVIAPTFGYYGPNDARNQHYARNPFTGRDYEVSPMKLWNTDVWGGSNFNRYEPSLYSAF